MCGLQTFADVVVSSLGVEHKKRLTIAVELAAKVISIPNINYFIRLTQASAEAPVVFGRANLWLRLTKCLGHHTIPSHPRRNRTSNPLYHSSTFC